MTYLGDIVKQGLRYTTSLVHTFLEALKNNCDTKLKFMDLTGFPTGTVICWMASAILLGLFFLVFAFPLLYVMGEKSPTYSCESS